MATFSVEEQRILIRFLHFRGDTPTQIHKQLKETCGDGVLDLESVNSWVQRCIEGQVPCSKSKQRRPPPPRTMRTPRMIALVEELVLANRKIRLRHIAEELGTSVSTVHTIVHDDLKMYSDNLKWMPNGEFRDAQLEIILDEERRRLSESRQVLQGAAIHKPKEIPVGRVADRALSWQDDDSEGDSKNSGLAETFEYSPSLKEMGVDEQLDSETDLPNEQNSSVHPDGSEEDSKSSGTAEMFGCSRSVKEADVEEQLDSRTDVPNEQHSPVRPGRLEGVSCGTLEIFDGVPRVKEEDVDDELDSHTAIPSVQPCTILPDRVEVKDEPGEMPDMISSQLTVKQEKVDEGTFVVPFVESSPSHPDNIDVRLTYGSSETEAIGIDPEDLEELPQNQAEFVDVKEEKVHVLSSVEEVGLPQAKRKKPEDPDYEEVPRESEPTMQRTNDTHFKGCTKKVKAR